MMDKINKSEIIDLLEDAIDVFVHQDKLIIDTKTKRIIIKGVSNGSYYTNLHNNEIGESVEINEYIYCEKNLKLILEHYPNLDSRNWLSEKLKLSKGQVSDKYHSMLICYSKNNRYSKQYWKEELEELKRNKENLEYHAKKYNRSLKNLKDVIKQHNL